MASASEFWPEVDQAESEGRYELVLSGPSVAKRIENSGLDSRIFSLNKLNFLEISRCGLTEMDSGIEKLTNLTQLQLSHNQIEHLSLDFSLLSKLTFLDLSFNKLTSLPDGIFLKLPHLNTLNVNGNQLTSLPSVEKLKELHHMHVAGNKLSQLPEGVWNLEKLLTLDASSNQLESIPEEVAELACLKQANFSGNCIRSVAPHLSLCSKLKELNLSGNPIADKRFLKMANDTKSKTSSMLDYLRQRMPSKPSAGKGGKVARAGSRVNSTNQGEGSSESDSENREDGPGAPSQPHVRVIRSELTQRSIIVDPGIATTIRPYLVACIVREIDLSEGRLKAFIKFQDDTHRDPTLCDNRRLVTIATHDMRSVAFPLTFTAKPPVDIEIQMLNFTKLETANQLLDRLWREAEAERKRKKRREISGVYQYLNLVKIGSVDPIPVMLDVGGRAISLPPITNGNQTKISEATSDILLEVTGTDLSACKQVAEAVIGWLLANGASGQKDGVLLVEQVRVVTAETEQLKVVFPARPDLTDGRFGTERES